LSPNYPHPWLAREGRPFVAASVIVAILLSALAFLSPVLGLWSIPAWIAVIFIVQFFRDPPRAIPPLPGSVLSPADGRIIKVEIAHDPFLDRDALKISVFMNVFNVHSNRAPVAGVVRSIWYHQGEFFNAALDKASERNESNALHIVTEKNEDVTCVQIAGLIARRILCYTGVGDTLKRGQRYGFIRFGSRVDVYLPPSAKPAVAIGQKVFATETILAFLED
jgi:phosphatidylserine decarboxylase